MSRSIHAAWVGLCLLCVSTLSSAAEAHGPAARSGKPSRFGVSRKVAELPRPEPDFKSPYPAEWIRDNEQLPRSLGPYANVPSRDAALQPSAPAGGMPGPAFQFPGLDVTDNPGLLAPPDTNGDVGPNHYVQTVNVLFRVWDKAGNPLTPAATMGSLFTDLGGACTRNDGDPIVLYDPLADRWLLSQFSLPNGLQPPFYECIAISQTSDPTGAYFLYEYLMPNNLLNDYPHFGVWPDGYYMSDNQFTPGGSSFAGAGVFAFDRSKMLAGDPTAAFIYFDVGPTAAGLLPADLDGIVPPPAGTPNLFFEYRADEFGDPSDALRIYEFRADFANPPASTLTTRPDVVVAAFDARQSPGRADVEQPPPALIGSSLDSIADRLMYRVAYRTLPGGVQSYVMNWTVNVSGVNPVSAATFQAGIRFTEARRDPGTGGVTIQNQVTYAPGSGDGVNGRNIWMGSAAQDNQGNSALGFSASSLTLPPSIMWAGRLAGDPADAMSQGEATMFAGVGSQTGTANRWGDYSGMVVDPADDCTFWYTNQYEAVTGAFNWSTRIGNFKFPSCTAPPKGTLSGTVTRCANGLPIPGAHIDVEGGYFRAADAAGNYSMDLPVGDYDVTISLPGFGFSAGQVTITDGGAAVFDACLAGMPVLAMDSVTLTSESCQPANGVIDPGETVTVSYCLRNVGGADAVYLVGDLEETGGVGDVLLPAEFGAVIAGGPPVCADLIFTADETVVCGDQITATLELEDGDTDLGVSATGFPSGIPHVEFSENFDGVVAPALPAGWTASGSGNPWVTTTDTPDTAPNAAFTDDPAGITDKLLDTPVIPLPSGASSVSFRNFYVLETGYDGGVLEISINGGAFDDIITAGGSFVSGGYNDVIDGGFSSPIANRPAWSGNSGGYLTTAVNIPPAALGQDVVLRFRMASDTSVAGTGWRVDTVTVTAGFDCCTPIPQHLDVDVNGAGPVNGVWEPGETVLVEPTYFNGNGSPLDLTGTASNLSGPAGATYTLADASAAYGTIAANGEAVCVDCYTVSVDAPAVRPAGHWDAAFDESLSNGVTKNWVLHIGASFADVPDGNPFYPFIETILHRGVTGGCGGTAYCPANPALRKQMAVFLLKARYGAAYTPPPATGVFGDVPQADPFAPWVEDLYNRGITGGCSASPLNFCPDNTVLRQQMAVFLLKTFEGAGYTPPDCEGVFADVPCPSVFADWIEELADRAITSGCGGGNFCPASPNTRGQMAVFLTKTFDLVLYGP